MRAWRREHPDATAEHIAAKSHHFEACKVLRDAEKQQALGAMPSRMVAAVRQREIAARQALQEVESALERARLSTSPARSRTEEESFGFMRKTAPLWRLGGAHTYQAAVSLATLCRNILDKPLQLKYRKVPANGVAFTSRIAQCNGALEVMALMVSLVRATSLSC